MEFVNDGPLRKRIRDCELSKIPYMAVMGGREAENKEINLRIHGVKEQLTIKVDDFLNSLEKKRDSKSLTYTFDDID